MQSQRGSLGVQGAGDTFERLRGLAPAGVEAKVRQGFRNLVTGETRFDTAAQVWLQQVRVAHSREGSDGDKTAVAHAKVGPQPQVTEHYPVGEVCELWRDNAELGGDRIGSRGVGGGRRKRRQGNRLQRCEVYILFGVHLVKNLKC